MNVFTKEMTGRPPISLDTMGRVGNNAQMSGANSLFIMLQKRKLFEVGFPKELFRPFATRKLPEIFQAREFNMGRIDKIFASHWLDATNVVYGTKCNKLCILNVLSGKSTDIPMIKGPTDVDQENNCGIHSLEMNPAQTMLATGGNSPNNLGVYKLPGFVPVYLGVGHSDWIFSIVWLSNDLVVTGSRDGCLGVWNIGHYEPSLERNSVICVGEPISWLEAVYSDEKVRAIQYNSFSMELASLSTKALLHIWDVSQFKKVSSVGLPHQQENVCLSLEPSNSLYAVGSQSHVTLLDGRCPSKHLHSIESVDRDTGIRSLSFRDMLVTIGTGYGSCSFFDLRTYKFLENPDGNTCQLRAGEGWLRRDEVFYDLFGDMCFPNAIYTHCYDPSGSKLFTGGGPLAVGLYGNYAALWQ